MAMTIFGLLVLAAAVACGSDDDSDPSPTPEGQQGQAGLCADLVVVDKSLQKVLAINPSTDVKEAEQARNDLELALTEVQEAGELLTPAQNASLQDTFNAFDSDVDDLSRNVSSGQTLGEEAPPLVERGTAIEHAVDDVQTTSGCPG
jgi:hypothetical protein